MIDDEVSFEARPRRRGRGSIAAAAIVVALIAGIVLGAVWLAPAWQQWREPAKAPPRPAAGAPAVPAAAPEPGADLTSLYAREIALAARLEAMEGRLAGIEGDSRVASSYATRAEGVLVAFAARRALDRGLPLGYVDAQLRERFGAIRPNAVAAVTTAAAQPVTTEDLRLGLDNIAPQLMTGTREGWMPALRRELSTLIVLREESTPSSRPSDRLTRARRLVDAGQVEAAIAEVSRMPGASGAGSWLAAAGRYVRARRALAILEATALSLPDPPAPPVEPRPATAVQR
jgi:hypothetical protein